MKIVKEMIHIRAYWFLFIGILNVVETNIRCLLAISGGLDRRHNLIP